VEEKFFHHRMKMQWRSGFSYTTGRLLPDRHWESGLGFDMRFHEREVLSLQFRSLWQNPHREDGFSEFRWWVNYTHEL
jgi:hypothetical protein